MTHTQKVKKVMDADSSLSLEQATDQVHFLDWVQQEQDFLKSIHPKFQKDFDTDIPFIGMCKVLWDDTSTMLRSEYFANKHIN